MAAQKRRAITAREPKNADRERDFPFTDDMDLSLAKGTFLIKTAEICQSGLDLGVEREP
jgi:hypothetical protein